MYMRDVPRVRQQINPPKITLPGHKEEPAQQPAELEVGYRVFSLGNVA